MAKNQDVTIESSLPIVQINGLQTNKAAYFDSTVEINGAVTFDGAATIAGAVDVVGALTANSTITATGAISSVSTVTAKNATAPSAAGAAPVEAFGFSNIAAYGVYYGTGAPGGATGAAATTGSIYFNYTGSGTGNRAYICAGGTAWIGIITSS